MSAVRMCDNCGSMFSVNEKNWTTFQQKVSAGNVNSYNQGFKEVDMGPCCSAKDGAVVPVLRPRSAPEDAKPVAMIEVAKEHDE